MIYTDKDTFSQALAAKTARLREGSDALKDDLEVVKIAMNNRLDELHYASERIRGDKNLMQKFILECKHHDRPAGWIIHYGTSEVRADIPTVILALMNGGRLDNIDWRLLGNEEVMKVAIEFVPNEIKTTKSMHHHLFENEEITLRLFSKNPHALPFAPKELRENKDFFKKLLAINGMALQYAPREIKSDIELVKLALDQNKAALQYTTKKWKYSFNPENPVHDLEKIILTQSMLKELPEKNSEKRKLKM